jgi:hypothetical protein
MRVVNASPLIQLARVSLLEMLRGADGRIEVTVPAIVLDEVIRGPRNDPTGGLVEAAARDWLTGPCRFATPCRLRTLFGNDSKSMLLMIAMGPVRQFLPGNLDGEIRQPSEPRGLSPAVVTFSDGTGESVDPFLGQDVFGEFKGALSAISDYLLVECRL